MKTILVAFNARYSHSCLAIRYIKEYNKDLDITLSEHSVNEEIYDSYSSLLGFNADMYIFSVYIWNIEHTVKIAQMLKKALPDTIIAFGGPEAGYCTDELFLKYGFLDYVILGEGEAVTGELIRAAEKNMTADIPGIAKRGKTQVEHSPCVDLKTVSFPYTEDDFCSLENKIIYFETSRGCPFRCSYCLSSVEKGIRYFPMEYVKKGFDTFFEHNVKLVKLIDRTFNADKNRAEEIIKYIIKNSKCTRVHFEIDPGILTDSLCSLLTSAPKDMFQLEMGIQSANEKTLRSVNRYEDLSKVSENIKKLKKANNMHIHLDLIAGLPFEDFSSFKKSFNFVYGLTPDMLQLGFLKVLKGTPIRENKDIIYADFPPYEVISTKWISPEEICKLKLVEKAVDNIYNTGAFKRTVKKLTSADPFDAFLKMSEVFSDGKSISRFSLYDELYKMFGEKIKKELTLDFIESGKSRPVPEFAGIKFPKEFKKKCSILIENPDFKEKYKADKNPENTRFVPIGKKVYMMNYKTKKMSDVTKYF